MDDHHRGATRADAPAGTPRFAPLPLGAGHQQRAVPGLDRRRRRRARVDPRAGARLPPLLSQGLEGSVHRAGGSDGLLLRRPGGDRHDRRDAAAVGDPLRCHRRRHLRVAGKRPGGDTAAPSARSSGAAGAHRPRNGASEPPPRRARAREVLRGLPARCGAVGGPVRSRPVQAGERLARAAGRRPGAREVRRDPAERDPRDARHGAVRGRGVPRRPAQRSGRGRADLRRPGAPEAQGALGPVRPPHRECRHRRVRDGHGVARRSARRGRPGSLPGEVRRR